MGVQKTELFNQPVQQVHHQQIIHAPIVQMPIAMGAGGGGKDPFKKIELLDIKKLFPPPPPPPPRIPIELLMQLKKEQEKVELSQIKAFPFKPFKELFVLTPETPKLAPKLAALIETPLSKLEVRNVSYLDQFLNHSLQTNPLVAVIKALGVDILPK